jgi:hypothetical protein
MNRRDFIYAASFGAASRVAQGGRDTMSDTPQLGAKLRTITLEEHFASPGFVAGPGRDFLEGPRNTGAWGAKIFKQLQDVGDRRIAEIDAAGIAMQILSLDTPGVEQADVAEQIAIARESNDFLADVVMKNPKRFAGFAYLPIEIAAPEQAADELDRRVRQGFKGTLINGHTRGRYLDDKFFWPILERAEALKVPIYVHPTVPPKPVVDVLYGGFSPRVSWVFAAQGWGWHIETASRQRFSICCWRSASSRSCSRPTILTDRWRKRARFWTTFPSALPTGSASRMALRSDFSTCRRWNGLEPAVGLNARRRSANKSIAFPLRRGLLERRDRRGETDGYAGQIGL